MYFNLDSLCLAVHAYLLFSLGFLLPHVLIQHVPGPCEKAIISWWFVWADVSLLSWSSTDMEVLFFSPLGYM